METIKDIIGWMLLISIIYIIYIKHKENVNKIDIKV